MNKHETLWIVAVYILMTTLLGIGYSLIPTCPLPWWIGLLSGILTTVVAVALLAFIEGKDIFKE